MESAARPHFSDASSSQGPADAQSSPLLQLSNFSCCVADRGLFDGIDLTVAAGECVVIVGSSGTGKSTLLDVIVHARKRDVTGQIHFDPDQTALLTQDGSLLDHLRVIDNLRLVQRFNRRAKSVDATALLREFNIDDSLHKRLVNQLSGGERRRVAIARALMRQPRLLLFDEPDTGLDPGNIKDLARAISELLRQQRCGVVVVTHNPWFAALIAQRVFELFDGKLIPVSHWSDHVDVDDSPIVDRRRRDIEAHLHQDLDRQVKTVKRRSPRVWAPLVLLKSLIPYLRTLFPVTPSYSDYIRVFSRTIFVSFISGALFFFLVGGMLGATTIAVVKVLSDNALGGFLKYLLTPSAILKMINGSYIVYLVPAISAVLFVARSGSIITSWLGVLVLGRQTKALAALGVNPDTYLRSPAISSLLIAYLFTAVTFAGGMWIGSITTANYLFHIGNAADLMQFPEAMLWQSLLHYKIPIYGAFLTFFITSFGLAPKHSTETVAAHTTKAIIYTTVSISIVELIFALDLLLI